jgi:predicted DCC family thiol-disulfide oxidoreductase YuxK
MKQHIILYDGVCNLCNSSVQFVIKHDRRGFFRFASLQSEMAATLLPTTADQREPLASVVYIFDGQVYTKSTAALKIARHLDGLWPALYIFIAVPKFIRDAVYNWIARNRYRWFGKQETCWMPTPELKHRFLSAGDVT